ncbi:MAG TPA: GGDEF domain-containing protein [Spongiibacteraceae bacterium]|nr:GGDEF domain-containing protein [Spongiibacteraceae bacterium]
MQQTDSHSAPLLSEQIAAQSSILHTGAQPDAKHSVQQYSVQQRVLLDCANRVKSGIFVYICLWLAIGVASGLANDQPLFWLSNVGIFAINALLRLWLQLNLEKWVVQRLRLAKNFFTVLLLLNVLHWGVLTSLCVLMPGLQELRMPMLLAACGIAASVASVLAIHPLLRVVSPIAVVAPVVIALLVQPTSANALIAVLCSILVVYFISAARVMYNDYWSALNNSILLQQRAQQLEELSNTDALTKIRNRLYFDVNFASEWKRACRHRWPIAVLIIDLDHFKHINDQHGHVFGDLCLQTVARLLQAEVQRSGDILARYGGEEFIIMLTQTTLSSAAAVAERLLKALSEYTLYNGEHSVPVTGSIGVASAIPTLPDQGYRLINRADQALYQAKERGRNQFAVYEQPATARADL